MRNAIRATLWQRGGARWQRLRQIQLLAIRYLGFAAAAIERSRQRRALTSLSDHQLRDVGITRGEAEREYTTPFWR